MEACLHKYQVLGTKHDLVGRHTCKLQRAQAREGGVYGASTGEHMGMKRPTNWCNRASVPDKPSYTSKRPGLGCRLGWTEAPQTTEGVTFQAQSKVSQVLVDQVYDVVQVQEGGTNERQKPDSCCRAGSLK